MSVRSWTSGSLVSSLQFQPPKKSDLGLLISLDAHCDNSPHGRIFPMKESSVASNMCRC